MKLLPVAAALLFSLSAAHATTPTAKPFEATGNITQKGCQLSPTQAIAITPVSFDKLQDASTVEANGTGGNATLISLVATACSGGMVSASIKGTGDTNYPDLLAVDSTAGSAQNVAIAFSGEDKTTDGKFAFLALNTGSVAPAQGDGQYDVDHTFYFSAEPVKTTASPVAGKIHATAQIYINYL